MPKKKKQQMIEEDNSWAEDSDADIEDFSEEDIKESEKLLRDTNIQNLLDSLDSTENKLRFVKHAESLSPAEKAAIIDDVADKNMNLVYFVANNVNCYGMTREDAYSAGRYGYAKAFASYDPDRKIKFSTFAVTCIRNEILGELKKADRRAKNEVSMEQTKTWDKNGNEMTVLDTIADPHASIEDSVKTEWLRKEVRDVLEQVSPVEKFVLYLRFGLYNNIELTQKEIAAYMGMSQANVSKIERTVLKDLIPLMKERGLQNEFPQ